MLKVNVGMSRKVSKDYNSTGFSINLEGEVAVSLDDPQLVVEKIKELYDFAEESLSQQVERYDSVSAIASHDEEPAVNSSRFKSNSEFQNQQPVQSKRTPEAIGTSSRGASNGNGSNQSQPRFAGNGRPQNSNVSQDIAATNKQLQFMLTLAKRQGMNQAQLETRISSMLDKNIGLYDLTKQEANIVITDLNAEPQTATRRS